MQQIELPLTNGSLLIMEGATQTDWQVCWKNWPSKILNASFQTADIFKSDKWRTVYNLVLSLHK